MSRLFLRIALGILIVVVTSNIVLRCGITSATRHQFESHLPDLLLEVGFAKKHLEAVPASQLGQVLHQMQRLIHYQMNLAQPLSPTIPAYVRPKLAHDQPAVDFTHKLGWTVYLPIRSRTWVLVVGPIALGGRSGSSHPVAWTIVAVIGIVLLTSFLLAAPLVNRLRKLEQIAGRISQGDLQARAEVSSKDAVGRLAERFNRMADKVQTLLEQQKHLMQAVSHELRTPVSRIRFGLEMLALAQGEEERQRRAEAIDEDLVELNHLIDELLLYIRSEEQALRISKVELDAREEIQQVVDRLQVSRPEVKIQIQVFTEAASKVMADQELFKRAMKNLLANAIRYTRTQVVIRLESMAEQAVRISVLDDGPGIPPSEREKIFEAFARLDNSRNRETGGVGLGLAIVRRIVQSHGGTAKVTEGENGGACLVTTWPRV